MWVQCLCRDPLPNIQFLLGGTHWKRNVFLLIESEVSAAVLSRFDG